MATSLANRGKKAEKLLHTHMQKLSDSSNAASFRLPDAHAGSLTATLCDFIFMRAGTLYLVECKSTKHNYRLPHGNVDTSQIAKMRMWKFAGAKAFVMIYHETLDQWRSAEVEYFLNRDGGSWDLREIEIGSLEKAFERYTCVLP